MAGIFSKVSAFARSAEGKKLIKQAQQAAQDPANRAKVQEFGNKLKTRAAALSNEYKAGARGDDEPNPAASAESAADPKPHAAPGPAPKPEPPSPSSQA
jgi:hypothetical protein